MPVLEQYKAGCNWQSTPLMLSSLLFIRKVCPSAAGGLVQICDRSYASNMATSMWKRSFLDWESLWFLDLVNPGNAKISL